MSEVAKEIIKRAEELWPHGFSFISRRFKDMRPWEELLALIAASPPSNSHPSFMIYKDTVTISLTEAGVRLFTEAEDKNAFVEELFDNILKYKERLDAE